jgi:hypothetical protein
MEARTCINPRVPLVPLFSTSVSTPTLNSSHKPWQLVPTMGLTRSSFMRAMVFQSTTMFLPGSRRFLGSLLFITDRFGDLSLQEPESREVSRSGIGHLPPGPVQGGHVNEAQLRHRLSALGKTESDPARDKADHTLVVPTATTDPIYQSSLESNSGWQRSWHGGERRGPTKEDYRGDPTGGWRGNRSRYLSGQGGSKRNEAQWPARWLGFIRWWA